MSKIESEYVDIIGYEGLYWIDRYGHVKNRKGKILKPLFDTKGYARVCLYKCIEGVLQHRWQSIARLVALMFISNPDNKPEVDHINGDHTDNCVDNLRWVTHLENMQNPHTVERIRAHLADLNVRAEQKQNLLAHSNANKKCVRCIETGELFESMQIAASVFGVTRGAI